MIPIRDNVLDVIVLMCFERLNVEVSAMLKFIIPRIFLIKLTISYGECDTSILKNHDLHFIEIAP